MAADHVHDGIRVNAVLPGTADTPWVGRLLQSATDPEAARSSCATASRSDASSRLTRSPMRSPTSVPPCPDQPPEPCSPWTAARRGSGSRTELPDTKFFFHRPARHRQCTSWRAVADRAAAQTPRQCRCRRVILVVILAPSVRPFRRSLTPSKSACYQRDPGPVAASPHSRT
jgi:hypothetical protein